VGQPAQNEPGILARIDGTQALAVAAWIIVAVGIQILGAPLQTFTPLGPGPGFLLKSLSLVLLVLALLQGLALVQAARRSRPMPEGAHALAQAIAADHASPAPAAARRHPARFLLMVVALAAYAWLLPVAGFLIATSALCWTTLVLLGRPPLRALIEAVVAALVVRYCFTAGLGVPLPEPRLTWLQALNL
jgi:Tripartite tricarboxylate transporter TctB family